MKKNEKLSKENGDIYRKRFESIGVNLKWLAKQLKVEYQYLSRRLNGAKIEKDLCDKLDRVLVKISKLSSEKVERVGE